jgi:putative glutamine amidotransferase
MGVNFNGHKALHYKIQKGSMKPLIGITCSRTVGGAWGQYSLGHFMDYIYEEYCQAILSCGGAPVIIPVTQDTETFKTVFDRLDGLLLSGGPDVNPKFYGEQPLPTLGEVDEGLDQLEMEAARFAFRKNLPILGICRGIQVLSVSQGGALYQDIPSQVRDSIGHAQKADKSVLTHSIRIERGSRLYNIFKKKEIWVNGKHHQAIKDLAKGFVISAYATDGIIEAIEYPSKKFVIGVQWHPEGTWENDVYSKRLFRAFVQAATGAHPGLYDRKPTCN